MQVTTVGTGPFKPALRSDNGELWVLERPMDREDEAAEVAMNMKITLDGIILQSLLVQRWKKQ